MSDGWSYRRSSMSPDGCYRLDFYTADRWQRLTRSLSLDQPGAARLVRMRDNHLMGQSGALALTDSRVIWLSTSVVIGIRRQYALPKPAAVVLDERMRYTRSPDLPTWKCL